MPKTKSKCSPFVKQCFVTGAVCCDVIGHGCIIGYPAVLLPHLDNTDAVIPLTENDASWIASVMAISMMIGIFMTPPLMGRLGRKTAHYIVILTLLAGWFLLTTATSVKELIIGRILQGLSFGIFTPLRSILIGEYTSPKNRGAFLTLISLAQGFGILVIHLIGSLLSWQRTALACTVFPFISLIMTIYSPESPSWLADRGKYDECRQVFNWLRGYDEEQELEEMIEARLVAKKTENININSVKKLTTILAKKEFYKPIIVMSHTYCVMSLSGASILPNFLPTILTLIMGPKVDVPFWMVALDVQRMISNTIAVYVIYKVRRRIMLFTTLGLCILIHLILAAYVYLRIQGTILYDGIWLPILLINIHYFSIAMGMASLPGVISGEIFPVAYRSVGGSISTASYAAFTFISVKTFIGLIENLGLHGCYLVYAGILTYNFVIIFMLLPETKGKTLQEIENEFKGASLEIDNLEMKSLQPQRNHKG